MRLTMVILLILSSLVIIFAVFNLTSITNMGPMQWVNWQMVNTQRKSSLSAMEWAQWQKVKQWKGTNTGNANQELHRLINTLPIDGIVLRTPNYDHTVKYGIVLLVISPQDKNGERSEIRRQWAAKAQSQMQREGGSLVFFLVGRSSDLEEEAKTYGDLLQVDIEDTYRNLVYKIEVGFRWLNEHVQSEFVAKIDSDTVVHIDRLYGRLRQYTADSKDWLVCLKVSKAGTVRDPKAPTYVSFADFPNSMLPNFCDGPSYVMRRATLNEIAKRMATIRVFEIEDVFFTGVVREALNISIIGRGIAASPFTRYSFGDSTGPILSILNTHHQFGRSKYKRNLTAAWNILKNPK